MRAGTTTQRGYGWAHQQARARALQGMRDGQPCTRCHHPMYRSQTLDLDHSQDRTTYLGLAHAHCNRSAGQAKAMARRTPPRPTRRTTLTRSRQW